MAAQEPKVGWRHIRVVNTTTSNTKVSHGLSNVRSIVDRSRVAGGGTAIVTNNKVGYLLNVGQSLAHKLSQDGEG